MGLIYYTGLARVARRTGYPVIEEPGWKTRGYRGMEAVDTIAAHHTATKMYDKNAPTLGDIRRNRKSQFLIGRDGTIHVVGAGFMAHAGVVHKAAYSNPRCIGIEGENDGVGEVWNNKMLDSYVKLCRALIDEFGLTYHDVRSHAEIAAPAGRKSDPNFRPNGFGMNEFRAAVKRGYWIAPKAEVKPVATPKPPVKVPAKAPVKAPAKPKPVYPAISLPLRSGHNTASHNAWVRLMAELGFKDKDLGRALQRWLANEDGKIGKKWYAGKIDGEFGEMSVEALQRFLKHKKLYFGKIDGKREGMTVRAEIGYLNIQRKYI